VRLFDRFATYNGSDPYSAPATLNVIPHLEHNIGAFFPEKGMYDIVDALYKLALRLGVEFRFNSKVEKLLTGNGSVKGLLTSQDELDSTVVVCGIDVHAFYSHIFPDRSRVRQIEKQQRSTSALIFYWGIDREFPELDMHNIIFSEDYRTEFEYLFSKKTFYDDPTIYIFISKKKVVEDAPEGKENWFVMINVPENAGQDWKDFTQKARNAIIKKVGRALKADIEKEILFEEVLDPVGIESRTSSYRGSLYGSSSNNRFSAFRRHPNFSPGTEGLYFTGGSVHPGGGIPLCLSSAAIASKKILKNI
jgi:phytoene desaturase